MKRNHEIVAGVDVGGVRKGFHAVALVDGKYLDQFSSLRASEIAQWCKLVGAMSVGIDAPISWSISGRARAAERQLMAAGIWCFSTPMQGHAKRHPTNHFGWMLNGSELYEAMDAYYLRFSGANRTKVPMCFETFPQAIACALAQKVVSAKKKRAVRRVLLEQAGVGSEHLKNIDTVDAALCALTAFRFVRGRYRTYGDSREGFIVVPGVKRRC